MKISIIGKTIILGEIDKRGKNVKLGIIDNNTGKGVGLYTDPDIIFER